MVASTWLTILACLIAVPVGLRAKNMVDISLWIATWVIGIATGLSL